MKSNYKAKIKFSGVETQLADCAVCMLHTYIAHDDFRTEFLRYPDKHDNLLEPYVKAYLDGQSMEQRNIGKDIPHYTEMLSEFSRAILMMYVNEPTFIKDMDLISKYSVKFEKKFPDVQQARIIFVQYAKTFIERRRKNNA